jgi:HEAT repeat protein
MNERATNAGMWLPSPLPRTFAACERDVGSEKPEVRASAVRDLVRHTRDAEHRERAIELIGKALLDPAAKVRAAAAIGLADGDGGHEKLDALIAVVDDDDDEVRQLAITALGEIGDARAVPRLVRAAEDERASMRYQAVIALSRLEEAGDETRVKVLLRSSSDDDFNIRYIAMRCAEEHFGHVAPSSVPERLRLRGVALLDDEANDVKIAAAIFLGHAGDDKAKPVIRAVVRGELVAQHEDEREAVELAGAHDIRDVIPDLERRAVGLGRHVKDTCAFHALIALARMGHPRAVSSIRKDLEARSEKRREAATVAATRAHLDVEVT